MKQKIHENNLPGANISPEAHRSADDLADTLSEQEAFVDRWGGFGDEHPHSPVKIKLEDGTTHVFGQEPKKHVDKS